MRKVQESKPATRTAGRHWEDGYNEPNDDGFIEPVFRVLCVSFCAKGESGAFIEGGERIALDGELPLNTHGGQLSAGRLHGYGFLHEAVVQLRGDGAERQVRPGAAPGAVPRVGVAAAGGGPLGGCLLLVRD